MARKPEKKDVVLSTRVTQRTAEALQDCADAENVDLSDYLREIMRNAARNRLLKLRKAGKLPPA